MAVVGRGDFEVRDPECIYVPDAFGPERGVYVREITGRELDDLMQVCRTFDDAGEVVVDGDRLQCHQVQRALRVGPEPDAETLFSEADIPQLRAMLRDGEFKRLVMIIDALSGYRNPETARLGEYRSGRASSSPSSCGDSGASSGSDAAPPSSASPSRGRGARSSRTSD